MVGTKLRTVLIPPSAEVLIQAEVTTKGWGQHAVESQQGGCGLPRK